MNKKRNSRFKRASRAREHIKCLGRETEIARLCVNRSARHIYAQVIAPEGGKILACASSLEKTIKDAHGGEITKTDLAKQVGKLIAERAKQVGVSAVASDRSGYKYHGRVAALVQSAREHGLVV
jgi:large subunit ribosomal protein L18